MPALNDGSVPFGSTSITINGVAYVAENIRVNNPASVIERRDATNNPSGQATHKDFVTGSATLQLTASGTAVPQTAADSDVYVFTADLGMGSMTWFLTSVGNMYAQGDARKVDIEFRKKIN